MIRAVNYKWGSLWWNLSKCNTFSPINQIAQNKHNDEELVLYWCRCCLRKCDQRLMSQYMYVTSEQFRYIFKVTKNWKKMIFKYECIALTKSYCVYWYVSFDRFDGEKNIVTLMPSILIVRFNMPETNRKRRLCLTSGLFVVTQPVLN